MHGGLDAKNSPVLVEFVSGHVALLQKVKEVAHSQPGCVMGLQWPRLTDLLELNQVLKQELFVDKAYMYSFWHDVVGLIGGRILVLYYSSITTCLLKCKA